MMWRRVIAVSVIALAVAGCTPRGSFDSRVDEESYWVVEFTTWVDSALGPGHEPGPRLTGGVCSGSYPVMSKVQVGFVVDDPEAAIEGLLDWLVDSGTISSFDRMDESGHVTFKVEGQQIWLASGTVNHVRGNLHLSTWSGCCAEPV